MIDALSILLSHLLIFILIWRVIPRDDLDHDDFDAIDFTEKTEEPKHPRLNQKPKGRLQGRVHHNPHNGRGRGNYNA